MPPTLECVSFSNFSSRVRTPAKSHATPLQTCYIFYNVCNISNAQHSTSTVRKAALFSWSCPLYFPCHIISNIFFVQLQLIT